MRWEYKTIKLGVGGFWMSGNLDKAQLDKMLNELGRNRWELVSAFDTNHGQGETQDVVAIFKRPLEE